MKEKIICAAIHFNDGDSYTDQPVNIKMGYVMYGPRYAAIDTALVALGLGRGKGARVKGFLTSENRFLSQWDALPVAKEAGQLNTASFRDQLYAEDINY